jgi:hypothetical protein
MILNALMKPQKNPIAIEPRWPVALTLVTVLLLLALLPERVRFLPFWVPYVLGAIVLVPMVAVGLTRGDPRWLRIDRIISLTFSVIAILSSLTTLSSMVITIVLHAKELDGIQLLTSSVAVWATNVLAFSLLYWQIDREGPEARVNLTSPKPDWRFPQDGSPDDVPPGWHPIFVDYLFLAFSTATAFSTTDATPLTSRAKLLMMLQSTISLLTMVVVASRAINILGS